MALKISNETKVGVLTVLTVTMAVLGFNFLKGKNPLQKEEVLYARFNNVAGLVPSNPVILNGLAIGSVYSTEPGDETLNSIVVALRISEDIRIPKNSIAHIKGNPLGTPAIEIIKGDSRELLMSGDTIQSQASQDFFGSIFDKLGPTQKALDGVLNNVDSITNKVNTTYDLQMQNNLRATMANLSTVSAELTRTVDAVNRMVAANSSNISRSTANLAELTSTLSGNKDNINSIVSNLDSTSAMLAQLELQQTMNRLDETVRSLQGTIDKLNTNEGTLGALINEKRLYNNIQNSINSLNLLLQDVRMNPKRYVNISVFGGGNKGEPLMRPMVTDSATLEQYPRGEEPDTIIIK